jgi:hypothetical protein
MHTLLFGYGSLINLESASRTLKRKVEKQDVYVAALHNYSRDWSIADDVYAMELFRKVKGIFLNIVPKEASHLNGIICAVTENELSMMKVREKNYDCIDVTNLIVCKNISFTNHRVVTFVGKVENIVSSHENDCYVFDQYVKKVMKGVDDFGKVFYQEFIRTTTPHLLPILQGDYQFVDALQDNSR